MTEHTEPPAEVTVPDFHGRQALDAWLLGHDIGLLCQGPDPDGSRPLMHGRVVDQRPPPGTTVRRWDVVVLWVRDDPGDLGGVREPRVPPPTIDRELGARRLPRALSAAASAASSSSAPCSIGAGRQSSSRPGSGPPVPGEGRWPLVAWRRP